MGMPAEPVRRFRIGEVPPLADGFTDRPDTAGGVADVLVPGSAVAIVPDPAAPESLPNWPGASGKTQIAVMIAESLWRARVIDGLIWISADRPGGGPVWVRAGVGGRDRPRADRPGRLGRGPLRQLAGRNQAALARSPRRRAGVRRPEPDCGRTGRRPAADYQPAAPGRPSRDAGRPGRVLQHPGGAERLVRTAQREPGPAPGGHRPRRDPRLRATGARPGFRGDRELQPDLPGLPGSTSSSGGRSYGPAPTRSRRRRR